MEVHTLEPDGKALLTVEEAGAYLGIGRTLAWELIRKKQLPCIRLGQRCVRVPRRELDAWIERQVRDGDGG
ncbi:MAG: helix-turn-helix domain-containing protein [Chloroflexota bacterium]|nr:helix-turn-helix domain-containing protein [Chloroflexota bacterium]